MKYLNKRIKSTMATKLIIITGLLFSLISCSVNLSNKKAITPFEHNTAVTLATECHDFKKLQTCQKALKLSKGVSDPDSMAFAHILSSLAYAYMQENNLAKSEPLYIQSIKIAEKYFDPNEINIIVLLRINNNQGTLYLLMGKYDKAMEIFKESLKKAEAILPPKYEDDLIDFLIDLSKGYAEAGNYSEAEKLSKRALKISDEKMAPFRKRKALNNLALLYIDQKKFAEARPLLKRSLEKTEEDLGPYFLYVAQAQLDMAKALYSSGQITEVEAFLESSLNIYQEKFSASDLANKAMVLVDFKELFEKIGNDKEVARVKGLMQEAKLKVRIETKIRFEGRYIKAGGDCQDVLKLTQEEADSDYLFMAEVLLRIGSEYIEQLKLNAAAPYFKCSLEVLEKSPNVSPSQIPLALNDLSVIYLQQKRYEEVEPLLTRALEMAENDLEPYDPITTTILYNLAYLYRSQDKIDKAVPLLERSIKLLEKYFGPYDPKLAYPLALVGEIYMLQDKDSEALQYMERAEVMWDRPFTSQSPKILALYKNLEKLYNKIGKLEDAGRVRRSINRIRNLGVMEEKID